MAEVSGAAPSSSPAPSGTGLPSADSARRILLDQLDTVCGRACENEGAEKAKELTSYGQLLHDLLDRGTSD